MYTINKTNQKGTRCNSFIIQLKKAINETKSNRIFTQRQI